MGKTRVKTTPMRMQQNSGTTSTTKAVVAPELHSGQENDKKTLCKSVVSKELPQQHNKSNVIATVSKRTNSVSSATSSMSHMSDTPSTHSESESPSPKPFIPETLQAKPLTSSLPSPNANSFVSKTASGSVALGNKKVYMITEKCSDDGGVVSATATSAPGQKRKMYLIMEDNTALSDDASNDCQKYKKTKNGPSSAFGASKKLTLFADKCDSNVLTEKFGKILPQILDRIQAKDQNTATIMVQKLHHGSSDERAASNRGNGTYIKAHQSSDVVNNGKLPLTLPPKKNRTKIITNHIISNNTKNPITNFKTTDFIDDNYIININDSTQQISAATPVIVSAASLPMLNNSMTNNSSNTNRIKHTSKNPTATISTKVDTPETDFTQHINLSTDFLFLMKMLPKLESIPEPQKSDVKNYVERIITQNSNIFTKQ